METKMVLNTVFSVTAGAALGSVVTYLTLKRSYQKKLDAAVEEVKNHYRLLRKEPEAVAEVFERIEEEGDTIVELAPVDPEELERAKQFVERLQYGKIENPHHDIQTELDDSESISIFDRAVEVDSEGNVVQPQAPRVISVLLYMDDEDEQYEKSTLLYYPLDDVLVDEREKPVDDALYLIGDNLDNFGVNSDDKNVVYIRNEQIHTDFEVVRQQGAYSVNVLGMDPEEAGITKAKQPIRRMRDDE